MLHSVSFQSYEKSLFRFPYLTSFAVRCSVSRKLDPFSKFLTFTCLGHLDIWFEALIPFWGGFWKEKR